MFRAFQSELIKATSLRVNIGYLTAIFLLPLVFGFGAIAFGGAMGRSAHVIDLEVFSMGATPAFLVQLFFGLFSTRSDNKGDLDSEYIQEPRRWRVWLSKLLATLVLGAGAAFLAQICVWCIAATWDTSEIKASDGELFGLSVTVFVIQVSGLVLGFATNRCVRDSLWAPVSLVATIWLLPQLFFSAIGSEARSGLNAADFGPLQIALRLVWREPLDVLNFAGIAMSHLNEIETSLVLTTWTVLGLFAILFGHHIANLAKFARISMHQRRRLIEPRNPKRERAAIRQSFLRSAKSAQIETRQGITGSLLRELYVSVSTRGDRVALLTMLSLTVAGVFSASGRVEAALSSISDSGTTANSDLTSAQQMITFGFAPTPAIFTVIYSAISMARDSALGELGSAALANPNKVSIWVAKLAARSAAIATVALVAYLGAITVIFSLGMAGQFSATSTLPLIAEGSVKLFASCLIAVGLGAGIGLLVGRVAGALLLSVTVLLLLPGVVAMYLSMRGSSELAMLAFNCLAPNGFNVQHWDWNSPGAFDAQGSPAPNPDERLMITGVWGFAFASLGLWRLLRRPIN